MAAPPKQFWSDFVTRWAFLVRQLVENMFSGDVKLFTVSVGALFGLPVLLGYVTGHLIFPDWLDRKILWAPYSLAFGYGWAVGLSIPLVLYCCFAEVAMELQIWLLLGVLALPLIVIALLAARKYRKRMEEMTGGREKGRRGKGRRFLRRPRNSKN